MKDQRRRTYTNCVSKKRHQLIHMLSTNQLPISCIQYRIPILAQNARALGPAPQEARGVPWGFFVGKQEGEKKKDKGKKDV